jgi:putative endonuclease
VTAGARVSSDARGRWAETLCVARLRLGGWRILARRFTVGRGGGAGEVDIIALRRGLLAFVEVKARPTLAEGLEAVTLRQRRRIEAGAEAFLARWTGAPPPRGIRFDVMVVTGPLVIPHLRDAWRVDG